MTTEIEVHFRCDRQCRSDWRLTLRGLDFARAVSVARRSGWSIVYDLRDEQILSTICPACLGSDPEIADRLCRGE